LRVCHIQTRDTKKGHTQIHEQKYDLERKKLFTRNMDKLFDTVQNFKQIPKLFVFDLDLTLWECDGTWIDTCSGPPFTLDKDSTDFTPFARSSGGGICKLYDDCWYILHVLMQLKKSGKNVKLAVASRTEEPEWACSLLKVLKIYDWFDFHEIYPATKTKHFTQLKKDSGIDYTDMIFFDDEDRNITAVGRLGTTSIYVRGGLSVKCFLRGLSEFNNKNNNDNEKILREHCLL
jgi:magnesium-dependent phosphatase 1